MKLAVHERIVLFMLLPATGQIDTLKALRVLREELVLSEEEIEAVEYNVIDLGGGKAATTWNQEKAKDTSILPEKDIEVNGLMHSLIVSILKKMADANPCELKDTHVELWDKFCA